MIDINALTNDEISLVLLKLLKDDNSISSETEMYEAIQVLNQTEKSVTVTKGHFEVIRKLIGTAKTHGLKYPKLRLGTNLNITLTPNNKGQINITNGKPYGAVDNVWYGRINNAEFNFTLFLKAANGSFDNSIIDDAICEFNKNPPAYAKFQGQTTGNCMFCGRQLTDPQSVTVGYGPVCAEHYGLPHGDVQNATELCQFEMEVDTHE